MSCRFTLRPVVLASAQTTLQAAAPLGYSPGSYRENSCAAGDGPTLAYAAGKRIIRAYLDGGICAADKVVGEVGPPLFQTEDMRAAVAALVEHGARSFRDKVVFQGR